MPQPTEDDHEVVLESKIDFGADLIFKEENCSIKKYFKTKDAILFKLSNKLLQIYFYTDNTELILDTILRRIIYIPKRQIDESSNYLGLTVLGPPPKPNLISLDRALNREFYPEGHEMVLRLKYLKRVITKLNEMVNQQIEKSRSPAHMKN